MKKTNEDREQELLEALVSGKRLNGYWPTRRELAKQIGISTSRVQQIVGSCTSKGYLSVPARAARAYVVHQVPASVVFLDGGRAEGSR